MGIANLALFLFGGLFLGGAILMGRAFNASRDRSVPVRARVVGFRERRSPDSEGRRKVSHYARFEIEGGPHAGTTGESNVGSGRPLYAVGDVVDASYDPQSGRILGAKGTRMTKIVLVVLTLVGSGLMIAGLYVE